MGALEETFTIDHKRGAVDDGRGGMRQSLAISNYENKKQESHLAGLKNISVPTMVMHGIHDSLIPVEAGRELAGLIPGARLVEFLGGHSFGNHPTVHNMIVAALVEH